jgi:hypothetical protein
MLAWSIDPPKDLPSIFLHSPDQQHVIIQKATSTGKLHRSLQ